MPLKGQFTGMTGVYLVAAELSKRGYIASTTSRNTFGADILVTNQNCKNSFSVQVKTNARTFNFWIIGKKGKEVFSKSHIYVLVNIKKDVIEFYVVPSKIISNKIRYTKNKKSEWYTVYLDDLKKYKDKWDIFGEPY